MTYLGIMETGYRVAALVVLTATAAGCGRTPGHPQVHLSPDPTPAEHAAGAFASGPSVLQQTVSATRGPVRILLAPGRYRLTPSPYEDPSCGNCADPAETVPATVGLHVRGAGIIIEGSDPERVIIETHAGYGVLFDGCADCVLRGVTVTGGTRTRMAGPRARAWWYATAGSSWKPAGSPTTSGTRRRWRPWWWGSPGWRAGRGRRSGSGTASWSAIPGTASPSTGAPGPRSRTT
jgi:hypothetical protein